MMHLTEVTRLNATLDHVVRSGLLDAVGSAARPRRDHLAQGLAVEDQRSAVVGWRPLLIV